MLKALYDYGLRRQLTLPPGFIEKTVKAYISLSEDNDRVSIYLGDDEHLLCPDMGSLAQGILKTDMERASKSDTSINLHLRQLGL